MRNGIALHRAAAIVQSKHTGTAVLLSCRMNHNVIVATWLGHTKVQDLVAGSDFESTRYGTGTLSASFIFQKCSEDPERAAYKFRGKVPVYAQAHFMDQLCHEYVTVQLAKDLTEAWHLINYVHVHLREPENQAENAASLSRTPALHVCDSCAEASARGQGSALSAASGASGSVAGPSEQESGKKRRL